jgi:L-fuconolactonase
VLNPLTSTEPVIEPGLPIVDAHHHLWFMSSQALVSIDRDDAIASRALAPVYRRHARYLFDEFMAELGSGHNMCASVFVDAHAMYRASGPQAMRSVGEVEFANGVAAMGASGIYGESKVCAGIVGGVDLKFGSAVEEVLAAHLQAAGSRYRGVRSPILYDEDSAILGVGIGMPHVLLDSAFRAGFKCLDRFDLSFDALLFEPQLPDLIDLARAFPNTRIILNHCGIPLGVGRYSGRREERFSIWRDRIGTLAQCDNVAVKLGGLGMPFAGFKSFMSAEPATSAQLADEWKPYIETCIEAFGVRRCMFGSNFPVDSAAGSYATLWNAFKRLAAGASNDEKTALFSETAMRIYRLDL